MDTIRCKGIILDLDGVITRTASIHFSAWKKTFDELLQKRAMSDHKKFKPFTFDHDYIPYVDGRPRYKGVKAFLDSRDISDIPYGTPADAPGETSICAIGNKKNLNFRSMVEEGEVEIFASSVRLIRQLREKGFKTAVASSSKNCQFILEKTGLKSLFDIVIGGTVSEELGLNGKPHPDIFLAAASNMKLKPSECCMVEDALAGVEAGRNGNFGLVLGVARNKSVEELKAHGADIAVTDLQEISLKTIEEWFAKGIAEDGWHLSYYGFHAQEERLREALTTVGNGYLGTRGSFCGSKADEATHYPGTYIAGVYNKLPSQVHRKTIYNNDIVNCPNWTLIRLKIGQGGIINPFEEELLSYTHRLDMKHALMSRSLIFKDKAGRITRLETRRIACMHNPHLAAIQYELTPLNYSDSVALYSSLDGTVINFGVARYRELNSIHLQPVSAQEHKGRSCLTVQTRTSHVRIHMYARTNICHKQRREEVTRHYHSEPGCITEEIMFPVKENQTYCLEKTVSIYTSRDKDVKNPEQAAEKSLLRTPSFSTLYKKHAAAWQTLWETADFIITGDRFSQKVARLHTYHLLVTASPHNTRIDAGMPARGLHGEAYRGHIFWDELFVLPFYSHHFPEIARALLMYRYNRLDAARDYAKDNGHKGAMYPWQTADNGMEETQEIHFNPQSGKWDPDLSRLQRHVSIAIAYNVWAYYYDTDDTDFLYHYGAEIMIEICRFWASLAEYDTRTAKYSIKGVMGPDEFHERYPTPRFGLESGLKDNTYTNIMAGWLLHKTIETVEHLPLEVVTGLTRKIGFSPQELKEWQNIIAGMNIIINEEGIMAQFDGYFDLQELDWSYYREKYGNIHRLDRILKAEGDTPDRYKISKQADTLMLYFLLSPEQVNNMLTMMNYRQVENPSAIMERNYEYYVQRASHGSTLSAIVHSAVLKYLDSHKNDMWNWFLRAMKSDIHDTQGGTTLEGIHCGVMAGTLHIIIRGFVGINYFKDSIRLNPQLPEHWQTLSFHITHRGSLFHFTITRQTITVSKISAAEENIHVIVGTARYALSKGEEKEIVY